MTRSRAAVTTILAALLVVGAPAGASAAAAVTTLDKSKVKLERASDGGWSTTVGMTNLTDARLKVSVKPLSANCGPQIGDGTAELPPAEHHDLTVAIPSTCEASDGFSFTLEAQGDGVGRSFRITATPATASPNWSALDSFGWTLLASLVLVAAVLVCWLVTTDSSSKGLLTPLAGLEATWSFKDSIVSNVTAASGLLAVVLGSSDVLKAVLGPDAEAAIAVASVAGAIALALVGAAGVIALTFRRPIDKEITILGLCAGTTIALWAAAGQVWAITRLVTDLSLGDNAQRGVWAGCIGASVLLVLYGCVSVYGLLAQGTHVEEEKDPLASPLSAELAAAAIVAAATKGQAVTHKTVTDMLKALAPPPEPAKHQRRRRTRHIVLAPQWELPLEGRSALP
jgi:hypothetical protein